MAHNPLLIVWPIFFATLAIFISISPLSLFFDSFISPNFLLIVFIFWGLRRPEATPPLLIFSAALTFDLLRAGPVGLELFALLVATEILRLIKQTQPTHTWQAEYFLAALIITIFEIICWALLTIAMTSALTWDVVLWRWIGTLIGYPILSWLQTVLSGIKHGLR